MIRLLLQLNIHLLYCFGTYFLYFLAILYLVLRRNSSLKYWSMPCKEFHNSITYWIALFVINYCRRHLCKITLTVDLKSCMDHHKSLLLSLIYHHHRKSAPVTNLSYMHFGKLFIGSTPPLSNMPDTISHTVVVTVSCCSFEATSLTSSRQSAPHHRHPFLMDMEVPTHLDARQDEVGLIQMRVFQPIIQVQSPYL